MVKLLRLRHSWQSERHKKYKNNAETSRIEIKTTAISNVTFHLMLLM